MSKVIANSKSVDELLSGKKYDIDFYQRGYVWQRRNVEELLLDLEAKFNESYSEEHEPWEVEKYAHYFLGTIITISESGKKYIVDGQQRLTTLTLLLIYFHHLNAGKQEISDVSQLIYSAKFKQKSFNIAVYERDDCMQSLFAHNQYDAADHHDLSVRNIAARYLEINDIFPESLTGRALPYFVDWMIHCVDLVEIETQKDDDAFTIFETMNDRGMNLSQADMLKGYLLANINYGDPDFMQKQKSKANAIWQGIIKDLVDLDDDNDNDVDNFFKTWLRAKYADTMREGKKDAKNQDFENIDKFHRWVRDQINEKDGRLTLDKPADFYDFITKHIWRFAKHYITLRRAAQELTDDLKAVNYNGHNYFTLQYMLALAPLRLDDDDDTVKNKMRLVATFADIYFVRRVVNFKNTGFNTLRRPMFSLAKEIRDKSLDELREILLQHLDDMPETLGGLQHYSLHGRNKHHTRYMLARMTAWIEQKSGLKSNYLDFLWDVKGWPFEIEHLWANKYQRHTDDYDHEYDFQRERNYFGGLILLPKGSHKPLIAKPYEEKLNLYLGENLLAASLHPQKYSEGKTSFCDFISNSNLPFKSHAQFKRADLLERQDLYRQICEQIWNPDRLLADH